MACETDVVGQAIQKCPFLQAIAAQEGTLFARNFVANPEQPAHGPCLRRPILEEQNDFLSTFRLFHGPQGVLPLARSAPVSNANAVQQPASHELSPAKFAPCGTGGQSARSSANAKLASLPLASISLPFFGNMPDWRKLLNNNHKSDPLRNRHARHQPPPSSSSPQSNPNIRGAGDSGSRPRLPRTGQLKGRGSSTGRGVSIRTAAHSGGGAAAVPPPPAGGGCPLRKVLGPFAGLVFNSRGKIACPDAIVKARAALARTAPVRTLRPQALGVKLLAVGAAVALLNLPAGAWREHMKKFSFGWFVAVHCTIPFVAMLRKAVVMPPAAIAFTIGAAVLGQAVGARLERARRLQERESAVAAAIPPTKTAAPPVCLQDEVLSDMQHQGGVLAFASMTVRGLKGRRRQKQQQHAVAAVSCRKAATAPVRAGIPQLVA